MAQLFNRTRHLPPSLPLPNFVSASRNFTIDPITISLLSIPDAYPISIKRYYLRHEIMAFSRMFEHIRSISFLHLQISSFESQLLSIEQMVPISPKVRSRFCLYPPPCSLRCILLSPFWWFVQPFNWRSELLTDTLLQSTVPTHHSLNLATEKLCNIHPFGLSASPPSEQEKHSQTY